ncbi:MAG: hypothetical protein AAFZ52_16005 [Bacteroidota bacterium]
MRYLLFFVLSICLLTCQDAATVATEKATLDEKEFELTALPGSDTQRAERKDQLGNVAEAGFVRNGLKQGTWTTYTDGAVPATIISYIDGMLSGPYIKMDAQGRYELLANYQANVLHGPWIKYRIGRPEQTATYVDGKLEGALATFDYRNNKIKQEVLYKNGVQHGPMRFFNEEGKVTLEYMYQNGEKVSGGIVE